MNTLIGFIKSRLISSTWGLPISIVSGIFIGLGYFTFNYGEGLSYFSKDPTACINCHIMRPQYDSWQKASHHAAASCVDCHLPYAFIPKWLAKAENGYQHSKKFTLQNFHEPIFIRENNKTILNDNCLHCHANFVHEIVFGAINDVHEMRCLHCHRSVGHGETAGLSF